MNGSAGRRPLPFSLKKALNIRVEGFLVEAEVAPIAVGAQAVSPYRRRVHRIELGDHQLGERSAHNRILSRYLTGGLQGPGRVDLLILLGLAWRYEGRRRDEVENEQSSRKYACVSHDTIPRFTARQFSDFEIAA
ncbi:hypothetical protein [Bradyrhizobium sp. BWA-3-5]|uniref:hypothetical protein n=1 Tax=Bradyrhizobium sp. BWA-3-5 TaxID=3080013 RepID=UPI00293E0663|nr:hypothetical protein [Bradyrhizobium sp. BWA-3-5]WOH68634.1 hypothetical protein RX331_13375 [Bradyrhizobium sp. BWA-3-5]